MGIAGDNKGGGVPKITKHLGAGDGLRRRPYGQSFGTPKPLQQG